MNIEILNSVQHQKRIMQDQLNIFDPEAASVMKRILLNRLVIEYSSTGFIPVKHQMMGAVEYKLVRLQILILQIQIIFDRRTQRQQVFLPFDFVKGTILFFIHGCLNDCVPAFIPYVNDRFMNNRACVFR